MKQRPDRFVAKTGIESFDFLLGEKDRIGVEAGLRCQFNPVFELGADAASRPADPHIFSISNVGNLNGFEQCMQTRSNTAGAILKLNIAVLLGHSERQSIGNKHNSLRCVSWQMRDLPTRV